MMPSDNDPYQESKSLDGFFNLFTKTKFGFGKRYGKHKNPPKHRLNFRQRIAKKYIHLTPKQKENFNQVVLKYLTEHHKGNKVSLFQLELSEIVSKTRLHICLYELHKQRKIKRLFNYGEIFYKSA